MNQREVSDLVERVARLERALDESRPRRRVDWDAYSAAIASLVGLLALLVAGYTAHLERKQVRASVWARLQLPSSTGDRQLYAINPGVGPARVSAVRVQVGGKTVYTWKEVVKAIGHGDQPFWYGAINGRVLPPGEKAVIFSPQNTESSKQMFDAFLENKARFAMIVCYCTVLEECWMTGRGALPARIDLNEPIDECPIRDDENFHN